MIVLRCTQHKTIFYMKTLVKLIVLCITTVCLGQNAIEKTIGEFSELKVYDLIEVELIKSDDNKIEITGKNASDVIINNKNGTLKIKMTFEEAFDGNKTKVILHYTNIDVIDANEGSNIYAKDVIKQFEIDLNAQEGAVIDARLDVKYVNIRSVTGGNITASGTAKYQDISIFTGGKYNGKTLITQHTEVSIRAAGEAYVNTSKKVDAKVRAGGTIYIYGNPDQVKESRVLGGQIKRMED